MQPMRIPLTICLIQHFSVHYNGISSPVIFLDGNRKRRLEDKEITLPFSKHKCLIQSLESNHESFNFELESVESAAGGSATNLSPESKDHVTSISMQANACLPRWSEQGCGNAKLILRSAESGSCCASNSFVGEYEKSLSSMETGGKSEASGSSEGCSGSGFDRDLCSLTDRTLKRKTQDIEGLGTLAEMSREPKLPLKSINFLDTEGCSKYMSEFPYSEDDPLLELGISYADLINIDGSQDTNDETLEYLSETSPSMYALLSGKLSFTQGAAECERKPTIDQEFEQYFSSLML